MLPEDEERREVEAAVEEVTTMLYRAAVHLQGKGYEPDLVFAARSTPPCASPPAIMAARKPSK